MAILEGSGYRPNSYGLEMESCVIMVKKYHRKCDKIPSKFASLGCVIISQDGRSRRTLSCMDGGDAVDHPLDLDLDSVHREAT